MRRIKLGFTDKSVTVFIPDPASTDGSGKTGLVAANLTVSYTRVETDNDVTVTDATSSLNDLAALTTAHTDWGVKEVSNTLAPGLYRLDIADAVFASGAWEAVVYVMITSSAAAASPIGFELVAYDPLDSVRLGLTALPNAAADAAGGLPISDAGALDLDTKFTEVSNIHTRLGTPSNLGSGATVAANLVDIEGQTDDIGVAGAGLTAIPWNASWDAEVQSEVADALAVYDPPTHAELVSEIDAVQTDVAGVQSDTNDIQTRLPAALVGGRMDSSIGAMASNVITAAALANDAAVEIADAVWDFILSGSPSPQVGSAGYYLLAAGSAGDPWATLLPGSYGAGTAGKIVGDNLNATVSSRATQTSVDTIDDFVDTEVAAILAAVDTEVGTILTRLGTPSDLGSGANLSANLVDIEAQTDDIGVAGAGLSNIPWNASWDAEVQSEVADALAVYDPPTHAELISEINAVQNDIAAVPRLVWEFILSGSPSPQVGSAGYYLLAAGAAGDPWATLLPGSYGAGTAGKIVGDNLNATVSSRATQTSVDTIDDFVDTEIATILTRIGTPSNLGSGATLADNLVDIENQTDEIGAAGAGLSAIPWNAAWDAEVQSEVADALAVYDPPTHAELVAEINSVQTDIAAVPRLVWEYVLSGSPSPQVGHAGYYLLAAGAAGDPWSIPLPGSYAAGTAGFIVGTNLDASVSSRASQTSVNTIDDFLDTEVAAILAAVDTEIGTLLTRLGTPSNFGSGATIADNLVDIESQTDDIGVAGAGLSAIPYTGPTTAQIADKILTRHIAGGSDVSGLDSRNVTNALRVLRNKVSIAGGIMTVKEEDDSTNAWTAAVTTTAGDPLSAIDPTGP